LEVPVTRSCLVLLLAVALSAVVTAETLGSVLRSRHVPTNQFSDSDLESKITSWAASSDEGPFLMAYYTDDGSGLLRAPLHVIRYDIASHTLRRADLPFGGTLRMDCLGSALAIGEQHGVIHIETHVTPSAVCLLLLSPQLALRTTLYGGLLGMVGERYAIVQRNEIHFAAVHPMRIAVYDLRRDRLTEVYPPVQDAYRRQFSRALQSHMPSDDWCRINNAQCDPRNFDAELVGRLAVNEAARVFGFVARYDAGGFGDIGAEPVEPLEVAYVYRLRGGRWEHREFLPERLMDLFGVETVGELVSRKPQAAF
jgi:hypothetical protein